MQPAPDDVGGRGGGGGQREGRKRAERRKGRGQGKEGERRKESDEEREERREAEKGERETFHIRTDHLHVNLTGGAKSRHSLFGTQDIRDVRVFVASSLFKYIHLIEGHLLLCDEDFLHAVHNEVAAFIKFTFSERGKLFPSLC